MKEKEQEKLEKYNDLRYEIGRIWECKWVKVIRIVIGALGTVSKDFEKYQNQLQSAVNFSAMQKARLLGTSRILRKVLDT